MRSQLEAERESAIAQLLSDKEELATKLNTEKEELMNEIAEIQRDRDEQLFVAETQRQEVVRLQVSFLPIIMMFQRHSLC